MPATNKDEDVKKNPNLCNSEFWPGRNIKKKCAMKNKILKGHKMKTQFRMKNSRERNSASDEIIWYTFHRNIKGVRFIYLNMVFFKLFAMWLQILTLPDTPLCEILPEHFWRKHLHFACKYHLASHYYPQDYLEHFFHFRKEKKVAPG